MSRTGIDLLVVGAGPAGLGAAAEAARWGARVLVADENDRPGGQLFKQIHKFFGSREHGAGQRGTGIAGRLLEEARQAGVTVCLETLVWGVFPGNVAMLRHQGHSRAVRPRRIVVATGATENPLSFAGCTLPGVMTAGAAQTLANIHRVRPGRRVLMVGSGNVGLIVSYQLLQAGVEVAGIVESAPVPGGYEVHRNKIRRAGVPVFLSHTILRAVGSDGVEGAVVAPVDCEFRPVQDGAFLVPCDTICLAVGLSPRIDIPLSAGCRTGWYPELGGRVPLHDEGMEMAAGLYVAGDAAGVEEASTALDEGRLAGTAAAESLGFLEPGDARRAREAIAERLRTLRQGRLGDPRQAAKEELMERGCRTDGQDRTQSRDPLY